MDIIGAKEIISTLAEGIDPTTGEILPDNSVCNKGEIVRALYTVLSTLDASQPKRELPQNAGKPWSVEDDERLKSCFESGTTKKELCAEFQRSSGSISSRLARLGLDNN
jgi:hypothetical protein